MKILVKFFAVYKEITKTDGETIELEEEATASDLFDVLQQRYPGLEKLRSKSACAINLEYVKMTSALHDGDEVCFIPPVSGGKT